MGPLSLLGQASPARGRPTQAAGKRGPTLPVPTASVPSVWRGGGGGAGGLLRQAPICVPRGGLPSWGMRREKDSRAEAGLTPGLSPSPLTHLLCAGAVRRLSGPLALPLRPSTPLPPRGPLVLLLPAPGMCFPQITTSPVPCFTGVYSHCTSSETPAILSEHDLTPQHLFLCLYSLSPTEGDLNSPLLSYGPRTEPGT